MRFACQQCGLQEWRRSPLLPTMHPPPQKKTRCTQASLIAEEVLKTNPEAVRILFNKFHNAASFKPTVATVLSAAVRPASRAACAVCVPRVFCAERGGRLLAGPAGRIALQKAAACAKLQRGRRGWCCLRVLHPP